MKYYRDQESEWVEEFEIDPEFYDTETELESGRTYSRSSNFVKWIQSMLNLKMGLRLTVDGRMGPATRSAIRIFQSKMGLKSDGIVGQATKNALLRARKVQRIPAIAGRYINWASIPLNKRIIKVMDRLINKYKFPIKGAAGITGNLIVESEIIPNRIQGSNKFTPMTAKGFINGITTFSTTEIMNRNESNKIGPLSGGIGIAQWTHPKRRRELFKFQGFKERILNNMDAQIDYLVWELRNRSEYQKLYGLLRTSSVKLNDASDGVTYVFEQPGTLWTSSKYKDLLPRNHPSVQKEFGRRRQASSQAYSVWQNYLATIHT